MAGFYRCGILLLLVLMGNCAVSEAQNSQPRSEPGLKTEWERVLAAAKEEGKVVVLGPPGAAVRRALTENFEKLFPGIAVEYSGSTGSTMAPKLLSERRSGYYLADLHIGNPGTILTSLLPAGALDSIRPTLILPDVVDPQKWWQGQLDFADQAGQYNLVFSSNVMSHVATNPQLVNKEQFRSYSDLLDPKWRGKITMSDPTIMGPGLGTLTFWYNHPDLGKEFVGRLLTQQKVTFSRENRQVLEWIARGEHLLALGPDDLMATELRAKGLPIEPVHSDQFKEGGLLNAGFGSVVLINRAPHPNAAKAYINWLLTKEGQTAWSKASGYPSRRLDVSRDQFKPGELPKEGVSYLYGYNEKYATMRAETLKFAKELLGR